MQGRKNNHKRCEWCPGKKMKNKEGSRAAQRDTEKEIQAYPQMTIENSLLPIFVFNLKKKVK